MCQSMPCQVIEVRADGTALVSDQGRIRAVSSLASDEPVATGEWVLVLSGLVLRRLTDAEAALANETWAEIGGAS